MIKVILKKDIDGCGKKGEVCTVSAGHARNYLLPQGVAVVATDDHIKRQKDKMLKQEDDKKQSEEQSERLMNILEGKTITLKAKHDNKKLFAAIDAEIIAKELSSLVDENIAENLVVIKKPIKTLGDHGILLKFDSDKQVKINVHIVSA